MRQNLVLLVVLVLLAAGVTSGVEPPPGTYWSEELGVYVFDPPVPIVLSQTLGVPEGEGLLYFDGDTMYFAVPQSPQYFVLTKMPRPDCEGQDWVLTGVLLACFNYRGQNPDPGRIVVYDHFFSEDCLPFSPWGDCLGEVLGSEDFVGLPYIPDDIPRALWTEVDFTTPLSITKPEFWVAWDYMTGWDQWASFYVIGNWRKDPPLEPEDYDRFYEWFGVPCPSPLVGFGPWLIRAVGHCATMNTPEGEDVAVIPVDETTGSTPVDLTFDNVTEGGTTTLITGSSGPPAPAGFRLGSPATYYDITTTASYSDSITVCIDYTNVQYGNEDNIRLFHGEEDPVTGDTVWVDRTVSRDTVANIICGRVPSLSLFAIAERMTPAELLQLLIAHVEALNLQHGIQNSLDVKLQRARDALEDLNQNNDIAAVNALEAFVNEVEAQSGDKIPAEDATALIAEAQVIIDMLTQGGGGQAAGTPRAVAETPVLYQCVPNPFTNETAIQFSLPGVMRTTLAIYDVTGRTIETLLDEESLPGIHTISWKPNVPAGTYFYRLTAGGFTDMNKMIVLR